MVRNAPHGDGRRIAQIANRGSTETVRTARLQLRAYQLLDHAAGLLGRQTAGLVIEPHRMDRSTAPWLFENRPRVKNSATGK
jgi:hypothetical protein